MTLALELRGVVKWFGRRQALAGLDLEVPTGSIFGLVGSNGAGKTTAMAVSVGLLRAAAGSVSLLGQGPFDPAKHPGRISLLPQDSRLPLHAHVEELLRFYGKLQGLTPGSLEESVDNVLEWVHLQDRRRSPVRTLSHGMMRRLTIAQAFLGHPELVLLDEPMSGLDPREASRIRGILLRRRDTQTVVISSHNLHEIETLCDHAAFIEQGRLVRQDTLDNLTRRGHSVTYRIRPGDVPLAAIQAALPEAGLALSADGALLTVTFQGSPDAVTRINAQVLDLLLRNNLGVIEVRCGSDLESEYLAATTPQPP